MGQANPPDAIGLNNLGSTFSNEYNVTSTGQHKVITGTIASTATDAAASAGNANILPQGLLMAQLANGKWIHYDNSASAPQDAAKGILRWTQDLRDTTGTKQDTEGIIQLGGEVDDSRLLGKDGANAYRTDLETNGQFSLVL